jgi:hypothetical protein
MTLNYIIPFALYLAVASPSAYKLTRNIAGSWIASADGLATTSGLFLHALVFVIVVGFLMPRRSRYDAASCGKGVMTHGSNMVSPVKGFGSYTKI